MSISHKTREILLKKIQKINLLKTNKKKQIIKINLKSDPRQKKVFEPPKIIDALKSTPSYKEGPSKSIFFKDFLKWISIDVKNLE